MLFLYYVLSILINIWCGKKCYEHNFCDKCFYFLICSCYHLFTFFYLFTYENIKLNKLNMCVCCRKYIDLFTFCFHNSPETFLSPRPGINLIRDCIRHSTSKPSEPWKAFFTFSVLSIVSVVNEGLPVA